MSETLRIAAFGFRSLPPRSGAAGADKFALELMPRLAALGHSVVAYNRVYPDDPRSETHLYEGVTVIPFSTVKTSGFDTLMHSFKATSDIIIHNRADIVHIQNGGNSIFALFLRLFGKKTYLSQDGLDWERAKWPWYARVFLKLSAFLTARVHNAVIFDNVFAKEVFERKFKRSFDFIPFGADVKYDASGEGVLERLGLEPGKYFLFVGRFIPDKGLHWLVPAFEGTDTDKKLVLIGGSPNPSNYEDKIRATKDHRIICPGFLYGADVHALMRNAYAYIQPSAIEGLSPVILEAAFLGAPILCSDIPQNKYGMAEHALYFRMGDVEDMREKLRRADDDPVALASLAQEGAKHVRAHFSWDSVVAQHIETFTRPRTQRAYPDRSAEFRSR